MKKKELVNLVFDRRKLYAKRGMAYLEVMVYLGRKGRRYITVCTSTPETWEQDAKSAETLEKISNCQKILSAMEQLDKQRIGNATVERVTRKTKLRCNIYQCSSKQQRKHSSNAMF